MFYLNNRNFEKNYSRTLPGLFYELCAVLFPCVFSESATAVKNHEKFLTTGCPKFDALLQGGIPTRGITQIYGAAGTGKTQLALQLCLTVQLPAIENGFAAGTLPIYHVSILICFLFSTVVLIFRCCVHLY